MWFPLCKLGDFKECHDSHDFDNARILGIRVCYLKEGETTKKFKLADVSMDTLEGCNLDLSKLTFTEYRLKTGKWVSIHDGNSIPEITDIRRLGKLLVGEDRLEALVSRGFKVGYLSEAKLVDETRQFKLLVKDYGISQGSLVKLDSSENYFSTVLDYSFSVPTERLTPLWSKYDVVLVDPNGLSVLGCARFKSDNLVGTQCVEQAHYFYNLAQQYADSDSVFVPFDDTHPFDLSTEHDMAVIEKEFKTTFGLAFIGLSSRLFLSE